MFHSGLHCCSYRLLSFYWCCCGEEEASIVESNLIDVSNIASPSKEKDKLGDDDIGK